MTRDGEGLVLPLGGPAQRRNRFRGEVVLVLVEIADEGREATPMILRWAAMPPSLAL
jgi:hypothetical protein